MGTPSPRALDPVRRRLLLAAAAVTLAGNHGSVLADSSGHSPLAPDLPPTGSGQGRDVLVMGAGIAGLVAAHELHRAGCRVRVLEARERVGGRCWTLRSGDRFTEIGGAEQICQFAHGDYLNPGANRILPWHRGVLGYVHQFGLPLELFASGPMNENWLMRRTPGHPLSGQRIRFRQLNRDMIGYAMERLVDLLGPANTLSGVTAALAAWSRRFGDLDPGGKYPGSAARGYRVPPGGPLSPGEWEVPFAASDLWSYGPLSQVPAQVNSAPFPSPVLTLTGGMDRFPKALAAALPLGVLQLGAEVVRLRQDASGVTVDWKDAKTGRLHQEHAAQAICTLPFILLARIDTDFDPSTKAIIGALAYEPGLKVEFAFRRRFWELDEGIYGGYSYLDDPALFVIYPSQGLGGGGGLVTNYYYHAREILRLTAMAPEERARAALADLEQLHPGAGADLAAAVSVAWARIPWSAGCFGAWTENARARDLPRIAAGDRRVVFAGEHVSQIPAWMEGAVQSAHAAIGLIRQRWQDQPEVAS
jgi:monoamine oxidase